MKQLRTTLFVFALLLTAAFIAAAPTHAAGPKPVVVMETSMGRIIVQLYPENAPITVKNFLRYVDKGFYDGTIFHRIIKQSTFEHPGKGMNVVQGGGYDHPMLQKRPLWSTIPNEQLTGLKNSRGTIAMARSNHPDSADSQFFFNVYDNDAFDPVVKGNNMGTASVVRDGYCAFGKVIRGMDVLEEMLDVKTGKRGLHSDVPTKPVYLKRAYRPQ